VRVAYADPPYPGCAHLYKDHPDYAGEVDHAELIDRMEREFPDGWALVHVGGGAPLGLGTLPQGSNGIRVARLCMGSLSRAEASRSNHVVVGTADR